MPAQPLRPNLPLNSKLLLQAEASLYMKLGSPIPKLSLAILAIALSLSLSASAGDLRITLPKRTKSTPVQKLNRDGVKAVQDRDYAKAKKLFYKAYLLDPNDPFTLNN